MLLLRDGFRAGRFGEAVICVQGRIISWFAYRGMSLENVMPRPDSVARTDDMPILGEISMLAKDFWPEDGSLHAVQVQLSRRVAGFRARGEPSGPSWTKRSSSVHEIVMGSLVLVFGS